MLFQGTAWSVGNDYELFDFPSWLSQEIVKREPAIGLMHGRLKAPRVILLRDYHRVPRRYVRFNRVNIYLRDRNTCQYCGHRGTRGEMNIDHVMPRSHGGATNWENVVCSCISCNHRKGNRTPPQAGMRLRKKPARPHWSPLFGLESRDHAVIYREWLPYLSDNDRKAQARLVASRQLQLALG